MDSSNRLNLIFGNYAFGLSDLSLEEMVAVFLNVIQKIGHVFRYFPQLKPLSEHLNQWLGGPAYRITRVGYILNLPEEITEKTKVIEGPVIREERNDDLLIKQVLFLREGGHLFSWLAHFDLVPVGKFNDKNHVTRDSVFTQIPLNPESILRFTRENPPYAEEKWKLVFLNLISRLHWLAMLGVDERRQRLGHMESCVRLLGEVMGRIQAPQ